MSSRSVPQRIRHIFLQQPPNVTYLAARRLLGWTEERLHGAVRSGEIEKLYTAVGPRIPRVEVMALAIQQWPMEVIQTALGDKAANILPEAQRLAELRARVPRYQVAMLEYLARRDQTTVGAILAQKLEDLASSESDDLSSNIPGFAEALAWPELPGCWLA